MDTWLAGVGFALKQLASLKRGDVSLQTLDLSVSGEAEDIAAYRAVRAALASPPKGIKLANNAVRPPAVSPYTWTAKLEGRQLVLTGYYPSDGAKEQFLTAARAGLGAASVQDTLQPAEGAPQDWAAAVSASVQALGRLENGSADLKDAALTVSGIAADAATADAVRTALRGALPPSIKLIDQIRTKPLWSPIDDRLLYVNGAVSTAVVALIPFLYVMRRQRLLSNHRTQARILREFAALNPDELADGDGSSSGFMREPLADDTSWFVVLELPPTATLAEIRDAYRKKVKQTHPDRVNGLAPVFKDLAEAETKKLNAAYQKALLTSRVG